MLVIAFKHRSGVSSLKFSLESQLESSVNCLFAAQFRKIIVVVIVSNGVSVDSWWYLPDLNTNTVYRVVYTKRQVALF